MASGPPRSSEAGFSLAGLAVTVTIMLVLMGMAVPAWRYVVKNDREEELIFRGGQIADAIQRYQKKSGNALPASLDVLVKRRFLRKEFKDPMTKDGKWRLLRPGEALGPARPPGLGPPGFVPSPSPSPSGRSVGPAPSGTTVGPFQGVASTSTEESLRLFNGRSRYSEWFFVAGQPRVVGRPLRLLKPPVGGPAAPRNPTTDR